MRSRSEVVLATLVWVGAGQALAQTVPDDPSLPVVRRVGFADAIRQALAHNPTPLQAVEELGRAQAIVEETRAPALPQLALNGVFTQLDGPRSLNGVVFVPRSQLNANVTLTLPLILPQRWALWAHAKDQVAVARLSAEEVRRQIAISVGHTYLSLLAQHNVVALDRQALVTDQAHADYTSARFQGGFGNRIDDVRAKQQVEADKGLLEVALIALARYREALGVLLGVDEPMDVAGAAELGVPTLQQALDDARRRSDVEENRWRLVATQHVVRDDYTDYLPTLSLVGYPFFQAPPTPTTPRWGWEIQAILQWQIYDGGLRYGLAHERARLQREAELGLEGAARQAASDVRAAADTLERAGRNVADTQAAAALAESGLKLATLAYEAGASTNLEVVDAERVSHDAQTQAVVAEDAQRQAQFDLMTASGKIPGVQ